MNYNIKNAISLKVCDIKSEIASYITVFRNLTKETK